MVFLVASAVAAGDIAVRTADAAADAAAGDTAAAAAAVTVSPSRSPLPSPKNLPHAAGNPLDRPPPPHHHPYHRLAPSPRRKTQASPRPTDHLFGDEGLQRAGTGTARTPISVIPEQNVPGDRRSILSRRCPEEKNGEGRGRGGARG